MKLVKVIKAARTLNWYSGLIFRFAVKCKTRLVKGLLFGFFF